jgi:hypothetical protein
MDPRHEIIRPVASFNVGKQGEHYGRRFFRENETVCRAANEQRAA